MERVSGHRNRQFDLLRISFAILVLLAHAPELTDGNRSREILTRLTHGPVTLGDIAVDGFFLLSGFLIVKSWGRGLVDFLRNRVLRIVPGYLVAVIVSVVMVGLLAPGVPHFFHRFHREFWFSTFCLSFPRTPPAYPGLAYNSVNGPLWTINYEFRCYLLVAVFGVCGLLKRPWLWFAATMLLVATWLNPSHFHIYWTAQNHWNSLYLITGNPELDFRLCAVFFLGGCYYLFREHILYNRILALIAFACLAASLFFPRAVEPGLVFFGGYLLFYFGQLRLNSLREMKNFPDISYGIYLYGWPVESLIIWYLHPSPRITFVTATLICALIAWVSWHLVERPMLRLKRPRTYQKNAVPAEMEISRVADLV